MILQGELKDFSLADILQLLLQQRKSGTLVLTKDKEVAELAISQGNIIGVRVGARTPETLIRDMLLESGRISRNEVIDLEAVSANMNRPLLTTLSSKGYLTEEERDRWVQVASEDMACDLFSWEKGTYEFAATQKGLPSGMGHLRISSEFACMEGMRRIDEWPTLREKIPDERIVFAKGNRPYDHEGEWERVFLSYVDGRLNMQQIGLRLPLGSFRLRECVVNLLQAGCIVPVNGPAITLEMTPEVDPKAEKDQRTALVLGISAVFLISALVFRLVMIWFLQAGGGETGHTEARVSGELLRDNAEVMVLDQISRTGKAPTRLGELVENGSLSDWEAKGPPGRRLIYQLVGEKDYSLK